MQDPIVVKVNGETSTSADILNHEQQTIENKTLLLTEVLTPYFSTSSGKDNNTIKVLFSCSDMNCLGKSLLSDKIGLNRLQCSIANGLQNQRKLVVALLGDSVSCGAGSDVGGYGTALQIYLENLFKRDNITLEIRNLCNGGHGPKFFFLCNELEGDEDIIIYQTVHHSNNQYTESFFRNSLLTSKSKKTLSIILLFWQPPLANAHWWGSEEGYIDLRNIAALYSIPFLDMRIAMIGE